MRRYSVFATVVVAALMTTSCDRASSIAGPQRTPGFDVLQDHVNEQDFPFSDMVQNPCTNLEMVLIEGTAHANMHSLADNGGGYHVTADFYYHGTGTGVPSAIPYKITDNSSEMSQTPDPTGVIRFEKIVNAIAPRGLDNFVIHMIAKLTVNANGVPTAQFDRMFAKCTG